MQYVILTYHFVIAIAAYPCVLDHLPVMGMELRNPVTDCQVLTTKHR